MALIRNNFGKVAALTIGTIALTVTGGCSNGDDSRPAASVAASTSGTIVTDSSTDLGSIVIGWGEENSSTGIITPKPEDVTARCTGQGDSLTVDIAAPQGWKISARSGSPILTIENEEQELPAADVDTANQFLDALQSVDWSEADQLDIAATVDAPKEWQPVRNGPVLVSLHVDCR